MTDTDNSTPRPWYFNDLSNLTMRKMGAPEEMMVDTVQILSRPPSDVGDGKDCVIARIQNQVRPEELGERAIADAALIVKAVNSYPALEKCREALEEYEKWEADLIMDSDAWHDECREPLSLPRISQKCWDRLIEIQAKRNAALALLSEQERPK